MRWSRQESALLGEESVFCLALRVEGIDWLAAVVQRVIVSSTIQSENFSLTNFTYAATAS